MHVKACLKGFLRKVVDTGIADYLNIERDRKNIPHRCLPIIDFLLNTQFRLCATRDVILHWDAAPIHEVYTVCSRIAYAYFCTRFAEWYGIFCEYADCEQKTYQPKDLRKSEPALKRLFSYLQ